jgi:hypothetical protein
VAGERGKGLAFDECLRRKAVLFLERQLGIARVSKEEIDHEGEAYLILCRPCQLKKSRARGSVVYDAEDRRDTPLKDTSKHDWSEILCSIR